MNIDEFSEKRAIPRLLCDSHFSDTLITTDSLQYCLISINYHRQGMAVFTPKRMPEIEKGKVSFEYKISDKKWSIENLPFSFKHKHETENGSQYGIEFKLDRKTKEGVLEDLKAIEEALEKSQNPEDRYGIFSKDFK
ncbi:MAG: hypothetical protein COW84_00175 [Gammaproteobacteria bacterium CG22_combo_CG10-13_8_21_14_all_40_8]|nr:MAG: hypothetical protein COW84_00175 [Gammaproteobacteria bacterium CG22_combo_CG10-13_8_21_14_all_40_8]